MPTRSVAALIAVNSLGEVLLMQRDERQGLTFPGHWNLVGGGVEPGETVEEALIRETREEIGISLVSYQHYKRFGWRDYEVSVFYSRLDQPLESLLLGEGQALSFFTCEEARKLKLVPVTVDILATFFASREYLALR